jgi:hypothetical protein
MHLSFLASYWWAVAAIFALVILVFVAVAGRGAEGGLAGRAGLGWSKWKALSKKAAELQARIILTIFYFTLAAPFGLGRSRFGDALRMNRNRAASGWLERRTRDRTLEDARRQF